MWYFWPRTVPLVVAEALHLPLEKLVPLDPAALEAEVSPLLAASRMHSTFAPLARFHRCAVAQGAHGASL